MFFNKIKKNVVDLLTKIYALPFNEKLADGTLPTDIFAFYLVQDALYLSDFSKALAATASRLPHDHQTEIFMQFAMAAIRAERELHDHALKEYRRDIPFLKKEQSPFCFMYTNYLLKMGHIAPVEEAVASLLPCFWIYQQVGERALEKKIANNRYQEWIDLYTSHDFNRSVELGIRTLNELAKTASTLGQQNMIKAFKRATQLEYYFWDGAYKKQSCLIMD